MKQTNLLKTFLLLCALIVGSTCAWADDDPNWSYTVVSGDGSKLNTTAKTFTVDENHVWSYEGTTVAKGEPTVVVQNSSSSNPASIKWGSSKNAYFKPVILTTSAFSNKAITKVSLYLKHNGSKVGTLTVKQGSVTIGTATTTTIDASGITNTDVYLGTAAGSLSASVTAGGNPVAGATVSWSSSNEDVATIANDGTVTLKRKGSTTITASYAGNATYAASLAEYVLNVTNSAPQETDIIVATNYEWLGVEDKASITGPTVIDCEGVTVTINPEDGTNTRGDDTYIRLYAKNTMKFEAILSMSDGYLAITLTSYDMSIGTGVSRSYFLYFEVSSNLTSLCKLLTRYGLLA